MSSTRFSYGNKSLLLMTTAFVVYANAGSIKQCPDQVTTFLYKNGAQFQICPNSDYQVSSPRILSGLTSIGDCMKACSTDPTCKRAVYEQSSTTCFIKGNPNPSNWVTSTQYDSIAMVGILADRTPITKCASQETATDNGDGTQIVTCPLSDYEGDSIDILNAVSDVTSCGTLCSSRSDCTYAVYDYLNDICHIKGGTQSPPWVVSLNQFDSIRIVGRQGHSSIPTTTSSAKSTAKTTVKTKVTKTSSKATATSSAAKACASGATTFTMDDGTKYEFCPNTDYQGDIISTVGNVYSNWDCMQTCRNIPKCKTAVYDAASSTCWTKDGTAVRVSSKIYNTVRFISSTPVQAVPTPGLGHWSPVMNMPVIPVAAYIVPQQPVSNKVLIWSSWGPDNFLGEGGHTQFASYDIVSGIVSERNVVNTEHDMFCPGISALEDGRIIIVGGSNAQVTSIYDPVADTFTRGPDLQIARGYESSVTTSSGKVFTVGGSFSGGIGGKLGEIFDPASNAWKLLPGAKVEPIETNDALGEGWSDNHAWLYAWKDGSVFQAGPSKVQHWYNTSGQGSISVAGTRDAASDAMCGVHVMYDAVAGRIFSAGGSPNYDNSPGIRTAHITTIGTPYRASQVQRVADLTYPRALANAVVLPDGTIFISGGQRTSFLFTDIDSFMTPELFDPVTKSFKQLAAMAIPRNYHSVSLLLADATVFVGGGGMCNWVIQGDSDEGCDRAVDHPSAEIFTPPYLLNANGSPATRPTITSVSTSSDQSGVSAHVGGTIRIIVDTTSPATFSLVRLGSATHSTNTDQRRVPLNKVTKDQSTYVIQLPFDAGVLITGHYYLFAMDAKGVPSVARTLQIRF